MPIVGPFPPLSPAARRSSLEQTLARRPGRSPVSVFAYGSLLWRPSFVPNAAVPVSLDGHARRFSMWTVSARGTPEQPGRGLALEAVSGGTCGGRLLELRERNMAADLARLWEREMWTGVYRPVWVTVHLGDEPIDAIAFVVDPAHPQYAGELDLDTQARYIAAACGEFGSCHDYLTSTVRALEQLGLHDPHLSELLTRVSEYVKAPKQ